MLIQFYKYQGAGNDFIILDDRENTLHPRLSPNPEIISLLCNRRFGIGADGLMLLRKDNKLDFQMVYFNSDGYEGSMCGNGGRCMVAFAKELGIIRTQTLFQAVDGPHNASIIQSSDNEMIVSLQMGNVRQITETNNRLFMDTGSPHLVQFIHDIKNIDVNDEGKKLRYSREFGEGGTNVNFAQLTHQQILVRTYERGVEQETLACGTGVTAVAIAAHYKGFLATKTSSEIKAQGGVLRVSFSNPAPQVYEDVFLEGPAVKVFKGEIQLPA